MATYSRLCIAWTSRDGTKRIWQPYQEFAGFGGEKNRTEGDAQATVTLTREFSASLTGAGGAPEQNDCIEAYFDGIRRYRGYVTDLSRSQGDPSTLTVSCQGVSFRAATQEVGGQYLDGAPVDVSDLWHEIAEDSVLPALPSLVLQSVPVGATASQADGTYKAFGEVAAALVSGSAENRAVTGGDVDDSGNDRLFFRPFSAKADYAIPVPSPRVSAATATASSGDVKNQLRIVGAAPQYPNLLYNASFERLRYAGAEAGNMLDEPGFESGGLSWFLFGGAAHFCDDASLHATFPGASLSHAGLWHIEGPNGGGCQQDHRTDGRVIPGHTYGYSCFCSRRDGVTAASGEMRLHWLEAGSGTLESLTIATDTTPLTPTDGGYSVFADVSVCPAGAVGYWVEAVCTSAATGGGLAFDDFAVFDTSLIRADRWCLAPSGTGAVNSQDWQAKRAFDGLWCLRVNASASDGDDNDVRLQQGDAPGSTTGGVASRTAPQRTAVLPGAAYRLSVRVRSTAGATTGPHLQQRVEFFDGSGAPVPIDDTGFGSHPDYPAAAVSDYASGGAYAAWTRLSMDIAAPAGAAWAAVYPLVFRGGGELYVDGVSFRDQAAPADEFQRDGPFTARIDCDDPALTYDGVDGDTVTRIRGSRDLYTQGAPAWERVESDLIATLADAWAYAEAFFRVHALPDPDPTVTTLDDPGDYLPGQGVRLIGDGGPALMQGAPAGTDGLPFLPLVRVRMEFAGGVWRQALEMRRETPDLADAILKAIGRRGVATAGGGGLGVGGSFTGGSAGAPPSAATVPALTVAGGGLTLPGILTLHLSGGTLTHPAATEADFAAATGTGGVPVTNGDAAAPAIIFNDGVVVMTGA